MENLDQSLFITVKVPEGFSFIKFDDIIRFEAIGKHTQVYTRYADKPIKLLNNITEIHHKVSPHTEFFRCHRSHIVSLDYIEKYVKKQRVLVTKKGSVSISRGVTKQFEETYCK